MNKDTLIPGAHKLTPEENRRGGINSGISRREKKRALEIARDILSMPVDDQDPVDVSDLSSLKSASELTTDVLTSILSKLAQKSINGDVKSCKMLLTISGDYAERQETMIGIEEPMFYDPSKTEYIRNVNVMGQDNCGPTEILNPGEVRYYDYDGNLVKVIYGEEAERLIHSHFQEMKEKGIPMNFEVEIVSDKSED